MESGKFEAGRWKWEEDVPMSEKDHHPGIYGVLYGVNIRGRLVTALDEGFLLLDHLG